MAVLGSFRSTAYLAVKRSEAAHFSGKDAEYDAAALAEISSPVLAAPVFPAPLSLGERLVVRRGRADRRARRSAGRELGQCR